MLTGSGVDVADVTASGAPIDAVLVGGRGDGPATDVWIHDSSFLAGTRNVVSSTNARRISVALDPNGGRPREADGITIERNVVVGNGRRKTPPLRGGIVIAGGRRARADMSPYSATSSSATAGSVSPDIPSSGRR
jgi:hypothetical protein